MHRLKERLIKDLDELTPAELMALQSVVNILLEKSGEKGSEETASPAYLRVREALADVSGDMSEDISFDREERI